MAATVIRLPEKVNPDVTDCTETVKSVLQQIDKCGFTGVGITLTRGGQVVDEVLAGEIKRDRPLALAALSRLRQRIGL